MNYSDKNVLFVDDEENILKSIKRGLIEEPFQQFFAGSARKALELMETNIMAVLVTDMRMPEMDGLELLKVVQEKHPDTIRIILTGYSHITTLITAINSGQVYRYLTKPWKMDTDFIPAIRQALDLYCLNQERIRVIALLKEKNLEFNKQNLEMKSLLIKVEKSDNQKSQIIQHISREFIPFINNVVQISDTISSGSGVYSPAEMKNEFISLKSEGLKMYNLLRKVEEMFNEHP